MHCPAIDLDLPLYKHGGLSRSIGLTLLECALGKYPYNAAVGPLILMMQVMLLRHA